MTRRGFCRCGSYTRVAEALDMNAEEWPAKLEEPTVSVAQTDGERAGGRDWD